MGITMPDAISILGICAVVITAIFKTSSGGKKCVFHDSMAQDVRDIKKKVDGMATCLTKISTRMSIEEEEV